MMGAMSNIRLALDSHFKEFATEQGLEGVYENIRFHPLRRGPWFWTHLLPSKPRQAELGPEGRNYLSGLYHMNLFFPLGQSALAAQLVVDALLSKFKRGTRLSRNGQRLTIERVTQKAGLVDDWYQIPVQAEWFAYAANE